ncbi:hypothetical protein ABU178_08415 [Pantoea osteomyelitidis]|uniref:DUF4145 domain-containing protein n=1 Tax=Pantoea osteomyelitidis TaxID=3230026 RepID=A0ABW7PXX0_9GAMM
MEISSQPLTFNFSHFEFLTLHTGQHDKFMAACETEDDIGVVLRLHLMLEKDLEAWCICASQNNNIFRGFGENLNLDFSAKNQLAFNFGLSESLNKLIKRFNKIRNVRAHQIDSFALTDPEIESLTSLASQHYPDNLLAVNEFQIQIRGGEPLSFTDKGTPNRLKLVMLYSVLKMRMCDEALRMIGRKL